MKTISIMILIVIGLLFSTTRYEFVQDMILLYEETNNTIPESDCPFTDLSEEQRVDVCKAYSLHITAGTTPTTFSPDDTLQPYEAFLMAGRTLQALQ